MLSQDLVYTTIGTCRIADPLGAATSIRGLRRNNVNVHGFSHTSKEAIQQIDCLGDKEVPPELARFLSPDGVITRGAREDADVFVVEISSVKEIVFGDWYLQINYLEKGFRDRPGLIDAFFGLKGERDPETRLRRLDRVPGFAASDPFERRILLDGYVRSTTREELEADMATIAARLPAPLVFVNHIDVPSATGAPIETRARLCGWVREICRARGYAHFDPTADVVEYGRTRALAEGGRDLNHYATEFKPILGGRLFDRLLAPLMAKAAEARRAEGAGSASPAPAQAAATPSAPLATTPPAPSSAPATRPPLALREAKRLIADGELDEAEALLHGLAAEDARSADARTLLGIVAFNRGDVTAAAAEFREAAARDPDALEPRLMLVKSALPVHRLDEACSLAADLIRRAPDDLRVLLTGAKAMMRAKRFGEAIAVWRRLALLRPDSALPAIEIARCEMTSKSYEAAVAAADEVLARDPGEAAALVIKSDALQKLKRFRELAAVSLELAAVDPRAAMAAAPALIAALLPEQAARIVAVARDTGDVDIDAVMRAALIRTLERRGKVAEERSDAAAAAEAWKAILLIDPDSRRASTGLRRLVGPLIAAAREAAEKGDLSGARASYEAALAIQDDNPRALRELAQAHERSGDWRRASERWVRLAEVTPDGRDHLERAGRAAVKAKHYAEAVRLFHLLDGAADEALERRRRSALRKLVRTMRDDLAAGRLDEAAAQASVVRSVQPDSEAAQRVSRKVMAVYARRLRAAVASDDAPLQEQIGRKMLAYEPDRRDALRILARLYRTTKRHRDGIEVLQRRADLEPTETGHWLKLARSCRTVRLYDRGVPAALKALENDPGNAATLSLLSDMLNRQAAAA